jgi:hypothetical protein
MHTQPYTVLETTSTPPSVLNQPMLSAEDKFVLYAVLQDIANQLRSMKHDTKNRHEESTNQQFLLSSEQC